MNEQKKGFFYGLSAYIIWSITPIFYSFLNNISLIEIMIHRIIWTFVLLLILILITSQKQALIKTLKSKTIIKQLSISAILILLQWLNVNWLIEQNRVEDVSLGYFLFPLVSTFIGTFFLKEKQTAYSIIPIILTCLGGTWYVYTTGDFPLLSITIALSFALYGLARKKVPINPLTAIVIEMGLLLPFAIIYFIWLQVNHQSAMTCHDLNTSFLLIGCGVMTAAPLTLFAAATKRLTLSTIGFMLYISSTIQFFISIFYFKETLSSHKLILFIFIWIAIIIYIFGEFRQNSNREANSNPETL
ncbi:MAG: EamA family transporter RarD [Alphaproteobacteria bacterium]|nr:EamA family transporter RarD [Alphaproteobacteria bacterium]